MNQASCRFAAARPFPANLPRPPDIPAGQSGSEGLRGRGVTFPSPELPLTWIFGQLSCLWGEGERCIGVPPIGVILPRRPLPASPVDGRPGHPETWGREARRECFRRVKTGGEGRARGAEIWGKRQVPGLERLTRNPGSREFRPSLPPEAGRTRPRCSPSGQHSGPFGTALQGPKGLGVQAGAGAVGWGEGQSHGTQGVVGERPTPPIPEEHRDRPREPPGCPRPQEADQQKQRMRRARGRRSRAFAMPSALRPARAGPTVGLAGRSVPTASTRGRRSGAAVRARADTGGAAAEGPALVRVGAEGAPRVHSHGGGSPRECVGPI